MNIYDENQCKECHLISVFQCDHHDKNEVFHQIMQPYLTLLYKRCIYKIKDRIAAEDLVQDILIRVYKALPSYRHDDLFKTWLYTITDNVCYTYLKRKYNNNMVAVKTLDNLVVVNESNLNLEIDFNKIIPRLSENEQEIIKLRFYNDLSLDEISHILRITMSACKMRLYRALQSLSLLII
ncbi:RNA polymerase sigma factor [Photobacterium phosphoreum]|uniref:RNA polymerase sigma factor n=1 Tax=Photobacterium phosphoreum TaxID=659 RepID=UPI000D153F1E|nr:sigma-70 family RNA polymerase sigma factor [Photobacterium phosphoreum]PTB31105.1 RNA polymerase subunit sigma-70 [Photobacterium phosphoreum]